MKFKNIYVIAIGLLVSGSVVAATPTTTAIPQQQVKPAVVAEVPIPKSVFTVPSNSQEGRNPFFPEALETKPSPSPAPSRVDQSAIVVNGITSPPRATVMLNGRTFEQGEAGDVKTKNGERIPVQVLEIKTNSVVLLVAGQRRELRFKGEI